MLLPANGSLAHAVITHDLSYAHVAMCDPAWPCWLLVMVVSAGTCWLLVMTVSAGTCWLLVMAVSAGTCWLLVMAVSAGTCSRYAPVLMHTPLPSALQVYWQIDELQKSLQFVSVSLDGHVLLWTLAKAELQRELLMRLQLQPGQHGQQAGQQHGEGGVAEVVPGGTASGTCIDFCKVGGAAHLWRRCWHAGAGWMPTHGWHRLAVGLMHRKPEKGERSMVCTSCACQACHAAFCRRLIIHTLRAP